MKMKQREYKVKCTQKECEYSWTLRTTVPLNDTMVAKMKCLLCRKRELKKEEVDRASV